MDDPGLTVPEDVCSGCSGADADLRNELDDLTNQVRHLEAVNDILLRKYQGLREDVERLVAQIETLLRIVSGETDENPVASEGEGCVS